MVSVIIPVYNTEKYLSKCLDSVKFQTYSDIEVILVDDGSTDNSKDIANRYAESDKRFRTITQANVGVSGARNKGLDLAKGEYILFVDSDDWLEPQMLEKLICNISKYNTDISCCQYDHGICFEGKKAEAWDKDTALKNFLMHKLINGSLVNKLIKRDCIGKKRLDQTVKYGEDALFLWNILTDISSVVVSPEILYHVNLHDDSASGGGSYKAIRYDCIKVWSTISEEAEKIAEEYGQTARAQLSNMAFYSLYEMAYYKYKNKEHQAYYTETLKNTVKDMKRADFISFGEKCMAYIFIHNMPLGKFLIRLKKMVKR